MRKYILLSQPIFTMSAQQNQLQNVTTPEYELFMNKYGQDDVSTERRTNAICQFLCCVVLYNTLH